MNTVQVLLVVGVLTFCFGRLKMILDSRSVVTLGWLLALLFVPFAGLMFMVRFFPTAKSGGLIGIIGMWLMVPWLGGEVLKDQRMALEDPAAESSVKDLSKRDRERRARKRLIRLDRKTEKVALMQARLTEWYQRIQQLKSGATTDPAMVANYHAEVGAFNALSLLMKEEVAELAALQSK